MHFKKGNNFSGSQAGKKEGKLSAHRMKKAEKKSPMIFISFIAFNKSLCHVVIPLLLLLCGSESLSFIFFLEFFIHLSFHNNNDRERPAIKRFFYMRKFKSRIKQNRDECK